MPEIVTMGEALIDLTQTAEDTAHIRHYAAFPGGAPANVAVAAARLGAKTAFIGKVGQDAFGASIRETLRKNAVDVTGLYATEQFLTTLAVVSVDSTGERSFAFYRTLGADTQLTQEEAVEALLAYAEQPTFLHLGSVSLTTEPARGATLALARQARDMGILLSYDPNYRPSLWLDEETALVRMKEPLSLCHILKVAEEELNLLTGYSDLEMGTLALWQTYGIPLIVVTMGAGGSFYRLGNSTGQVAAQPVSVVDTNGAGDTFLGALLSRLVLSGGLERLTKVQLEADLAFANQAAALTCTRSGAIPAMPRLDEVISKGERTQQEK